MWGQGHHVQLCRLCPAQRHASTKVAGVGERGLNSNSALSLPTKPWALEQARLSTRSRFFLFVQRCSVRLAVPLRGVPTLPQSPPLPFVFSLMLSVILQPLVLFMSTTCLALGAEQEKPQGSLGSAGTAQPLPHGRVCHSSLWLQGPGWAIGLAGLQVGFPDLPIRSLAGKERGSSRLELFFMLFLLFHPSISSSFQKKCFLCAKGRKPEQVQGVPEGHFLFQRRIWDMSEEVFPKSTPCLAWVQT